MRAGAESILAVHPGALGDVILFGHLLRHVGGRVTLAAGGEKARLLAGLGAVGAAIDFDALPMHEVFLPAEAARQGGLAGMLGRHDRLISCFAAGNPAAEAALAAACGADSAVFLPVRPPADFPGHLLGFWTGRMGLSPVGRAPAAWCVPAEWRRQAAGVLAAAGLAAEGRYVVMHPGAGAAAKCWPVERFAPLAETFHRDEEANMVWVIGPVERERWGDDAAKALAAAGTVLPPVDLATLAGVIAGAAGFVGNDSGPAHLAAAVGARAVVVASQASARQFAPLGAAVVMVSGRAVAEVPPAAVARALAGALSGPAGGEQRRGAGEGGVFNNRQ